MTPSLVKLTIVFLLTVLPLLTVFFMVLQVVFGAPRPMAAARPQRVAARKARPAVRIAPIRIPSPVLASIRQLAVREQPQSRQKVA